MNFRNIPNFNRRGKFWIADRTFADFPALLLHLQSVVTITRCEYMVAMMAFEYEGFGPIFEQAEPFEASPLYLLTFDAGDKMTMTEQKLIAESVPYASCSFPNSEAIPEKFRPKKDLKQEIPGTIPFCEKWPACKCDGPNLCEDRTPGKDPNVASVCDAIERELPGTVPATESSAPESEPVNREGLEKDIFDGRE
jgi:hypothetical protein